MTLLFCNYPATSLLGMMICLLAWAYMSAASMQHGADLSKHMQMCVE